MDDVKLVKASSSVIKEENVDPFTSSPPRDTTMRKRGFCLRNAEMSVYMSGKNKILLFYFLCPFSILIQLLNDLILNLLSERYNFPNSSSPTDV